MRYGSGLSRLLSQKIRNIQPLFSLFFGSVFFEVVGNDDGEVEFEGFLFPPVAGTKIREGNHFAVTQDVEFGGFKFREAAGSEPNIIWEFCLGNNGGFFTFHNGHRCIGDFSKQVFAKEALGEIIALFVKEAVCPGSGGKRLFERRPAE